MGCGGCGKPIAGELGSSLGNHCLCPSTTFTRVSDGSLVASLIGCVDSIRDIKTQLGARPYEVWLVWTAWTGGERHSGEEYLVREELLSPTPAVAGMGELDEQVTEVGRSEVGTVNVSEVSARYDENYLSGWWNGLPLPKDQSFYWEISAPQAPGSPRRRFFPAGVPERDATGFQWKVSLARAHADRQPDGSLA